jgi:tetratricopeptide (TPR) repeat protein
LVTTARIELNSLAGTSSWQLRKDEPIPLPPPRDESERILLGALEKAKEALRIFKRFQEWTRIRHAGADGDGSTYVIREWADERNVAFTNITIAIMQSALGRADRAIEAGKSALDYGRESKIEMIELLALRHLAECYLRAGDDANAIDHARQAIKFCASIANEFEDDYEIAVTHAIAGRVLLRAEPATSALAKEGKEALSRARTVMDGFIARVPDGITADQAKGLRAQVNFPQT